MDEVNLGGVTRGRAAIARRTDSYVGWNGFHVERVGPVVQSGSYVAHAAIYGGSSPIVVYELTPDGKVITCGRSLI